jgi:fibronectin type 3 domain-containing protein
LPYANVSAFRAGNYIFGASDGWTSPRTVSGVTGTVYLKVEAGDTGTYAIKYYDSTLMRPQESMTIYSVVGTPSPSCVISWNYVSGVIGYHLYRSDSLSGSYAPIADITEWWNTWNISYTDTSVSLGSTYYYKVAAYNTIGEGQLSAAISGTPPASSAITALSDNTWTDGEIVTPVDVKWYSFTASEGSTYQVQWNTRYNGDGTYTLPYANVSAFTADGDYIFYPTSDGWTYPQTVSGVTGTVYLKVEAGGSAGTYAIRYYDPTSLPPQAAMNIYSVNATPAPSCVIEWNYVDGVIGYRLYRSDSLDGVYAQIGADITGYDNNFYTDLGVSAGSTYYYKVAAYNANGEGERSAAVSGTPIGMFTMTGTLAVTVNGMALNFSDGGSYRLIAYADAYNDNIGEASPSADGAWTMAIRERYDGTMVYFGLIFGNDGLFFKLGSKMASTNPIALSGTFTTKTISGTVKDGATPVMAQVMLLDGTADTFDALLEKLQSGEIAYIASTSSESGLWTISVLDDVADAYILVENFISDSSVHGYITKNKVTLTAGAAINLVIGEMNDIGVYDY